MTQGLEITDPVAYRKQLEEHLSGRDPVEVMSETPDRLRQLFSDRSAEETRQRPFAGKWTPLEVLGHLIDAEWSFAWRIRTTLGDERPRIEAMDQDRWVQAQAFNEQEPCQLLDDFELLRRINLRLWRRMTPEDLQRVGLHRDRGEESLELMRVMLAGHDLSHLNQIERYFAAIDGA